MIRFLRNFAGILLALFVFAVCFIFFALHTATRSSVQPGDEHESTLVNDSITIYRNKFSVPHIITRNDVDGYFALGYVHAQDRLWQMDIARRAGKGQLAQILGKKALGTDKFMRSFDMQTLAKQEWKVSGKQSRAIMEAYSKGVNFFLETSNGALPFEFGALDYNPSPWEPTDCLVIGKMMSLELSMSIWADIAFGEIAARMGAERAKELLPSYPSAGPVIIPSVYAPIERPANKDSIKQESLSLYQSDKETEGLMAVMGTIADTARSYLGIRGSGNGSNCWTMKKHGQSKSGTILANDPHLTLSLPARWYPVHLTTPTMNIVGMTLAGVPVCIVGRNDNIAWGITNMMADDFDYFIEKIDSTNNNYYFDDKGARKKFMYRRDTIFVRDDEPLIYDIRFTSRSPVISDAHLFSDTEHLLLIGNSKKEDYFVNNRVLTYRWTAKFAADNIGALAKVHRAKSWRDFTTALHGWGAPALNFVYADRSGNHGVVPAGMLPKRGNAAPFMPANGWTPGTDWQGIWATGILPTAYNPPRRFIAVANNKVSDNDNVFITDWWEPSSRAERLHQALSQFDEYDVRDAQFLQQDIISPYAKKMLADIVPILQTKRKYLPKDADSVLTLLQRWDGLMGAGKWQPAVFSLFHDELIRSTFADDMGERLFRQYSFIANVPVRKIAELLQDKKSIWFDDKKTAHKEDRDEIVFQSFVRAVRRAKSIAVNGSVFSAEYGSIHKVSLLHIFSSNPLLDKIVTHGPFETGGSSTTLNNGEWRVFDPFKQVLGASMRFIADMEDSVVYTVLPGGISGEPLSAHYSNQIQLWLKGGYVKVPVERKPSIGESLFVTIIREEQ
ncbi:MAG TPA: penicillin acylase family protein [Candidatus Kapabacteria bacterium]|nr:penicillin acylase family protein [Candidatus Kapabacteria bacterium]